MEARRCTIHGLVAADDGRCVICRRGDASADEMPVPRQISPTTIVIALGGFALGGVLAYWITRAPVKTAPLEQPAKIAQTAPTPVSEPEPPRPRPQPPVLPPPPSRDTQPTDVAADVQPKEDPKLTAAKQRVSIKLYSTPACTYCPMSRAWLTQHRYRYAEYDIDQSETDKVEMQSLNPAMTVPTFDVGGVPVIGFDPVALDTAITRVAMARMR